MIKKLFNSSVNQRYFPNIQDLFSIELKADSTIRKIIGIVRAMFLLPWLIVKDAAHNVNRLLGRNSKKNFTFSGIYSTGLAKLKYLSSLKISGVQTIDKVLKLALVGGAVLGGAYPYISIRPTPNTPDLRTLIIITGFLALTGFGAAVLNLKKIVDSELNDNPQYMRAIKLKEDLMNVDYSQAKCLDDLGLVQKEATEKLNEFKGVVLNLSKASPHISNILEREFGFSKNYNKLLCEKYNERRVEIQQKQSEAEMSLKRMELYREIAEVKDVIKDVVSRMRYSDVTNELKSMSNDILPRIKSAKENIKKLLEGDALDEGNKALVKSSLKEDETFLTNWEQYFSDIPAFEFQKRRE